MDPASEENRAAVRLRFPKSARLTSPGEFRAVKERGTSAGGRFLVLGVLYDPPKPTGAARIGFITTKRLGGAVVRNRVRRQLREAVRASRPGLVQGVWLAVIARPSAARASAAELNEDWLRLARRASIFVRGPAVS